MHSYTRVELEEQVNYYGASMSTGGLGGSIDKYNVDYFTPQPDSSKFSHLRLDELENDGDRTQLPTTYVLEATSPLEPVISLPFPTPSILGFTDSLAIVIGAPLIPQPAVVTPLVMVTKNLTTTLPLTLVPLPNIVEDSLRFSFEAASGVEGGSSEGPSSGSTPFSPSSKVADESPALAQIPSSANSLLQLLAPHIMTMVYGRARMPSILVEATALLWSQCCHCLPSIPLLKIHLKNFSSSALATFCSC